MKISPNYKDDDWRRLKFDREEDWITAIDIFKDRISGRFLIPISKIENYEYSGFAVMALDCLMIETLQQFFKGTFKTPQGKGKEYFADFLTNTSFNNHFDTNMAEMFYSQIRCGILHQAEVESNSKIRITTELPLVQYTDDKKGLVINRKEFHSQLKEEIRIYVRKLKNPLNTDLRGNFKKKMDYICRIFI